ncbi:PhzF family phenazine biosynthesis protein [Micropruina glycogenica]|uniref:Uncharacterized protein n=1 Tax=Micropruina glycogenica TaxID=75385 RepID=A0A2N9JIK7_9ACTN|nr:PhzF family phenazine biosynthesis isomerase [Micropruina glycogenica]SPD87368.1 protein of unknown function [Micropruina glycogenica]
MTNRPFRQVDVFGSRDFSGNPLAAVLDAEGLSDDDLRRISVWTNLSECTFVLPPTIPDADYRVRIFSLANELPFAGHPTLGTARTVAEADIAARVVVNAAGVWAAHVQHLAGAMRTVPDPAQRCAEPTALTPCGCAPRSLRGSRPCAGSPWPVRGSA